MPDHLAQNDDHNEHDEHDERDSASTENAGESIDSATSPESGPEAGSESDSADGAPITSVNAEHDDVSQRRSAGRIHVEGVRVKKGVVLDASSGGLRIKGKPPRGCTIGSVIAIEVTGDDETIAVEGEVRWLQRHPMRGATFGISFVNLSDEGRRQLFGVIRRAGTETRCRWMAA